MVPKKPWRSVWHHLDHGPFPSRLWKSTFQVFGKSRLHLLVGLFLDPRVYWRQVLLIGKSLLCPSLLFPPFAFIFSFNFAILREIHFRDWLFLLPQTRPFGSWIQFPTRDPFRLLAIDNASVAQMVKFGASKTLFFLSGKYSRRRKRSRVKINLPRNQMVHHPVHLIHLPSEEPFYRQYITFVSSHFLNIYIIYTYRYRWNPVGL